MAELSRATEAPVATLKFYLRERLLHPGKLTSPNQAQYGDEHVRRVHLIRALLGPGRLDVATAREVIAAIDSDLPLPQVFGIAQRAASPAVEQEAVQPSALERADALLADLQIHSGNPGRAGVAAVVQAIDEIGHAHQADWYRRYLEAALMVAQADLDVVDGRATRDEKAETVVIGTVLGDALFAALRRAAQEHLSVARSEPGRA
jgi:DNA-binding transcriptional MerR regulator